MAEALATVGALAAASQLADQCLKITLFFYQISSRVRGARDFIDKSSQQLEALVSISRQIIVNPSLQSQTTADMLEGCLTEAKSLSHVLQAAIISENDGRLKRFKKSISGLRKLGTIEAKLESLDRWRALLALCVAEVHASNAHATSQDILLSAGVSNTLAKHTSSNVLTLLDNLPSIFTQLSAVNSELCSVSAQIKRNSEQAASSIRISQNLASILQHLMIHQQGSLQHAYLASNIVTHFVVPIPHHRTLAAFDNIIEDIKHLYLSESVRIVTLIGAACGGKTHVAVKFCHQAQQHQQFGAIFWVNAHSPSTISSSFKAIAKSLKISPTSSIETVISILTAWPCRWLMVFDNYKGDDVGKALETYMPKSEQGAFLITRKAGILSDEKLNQAAIRLPDLQLQDALELLLLISGIERSDDNYEDALRLVRVLEKNPRKVMQAGKTIRKHKIGPKQYLKRLEESR